MIGNQIGHFRILEKLGAGGMGEVYLALDTRLERKVALKFLPAPYSDDADFRARFQREAKATAALNHPNIVTVYDVADFDGRVFMVCEHVSGHALESLEAGTKLPLENFLDLASQLCEGLSAAHKAGIVHRDIKPANILIDDDGRVRILDFGLATVTGGARLTKAGHAAGTLMYMSPEQVRGEEVDARSDIFSLGAVLYELLAGKPAFGGAYDAAIVYAIAHDPPEPLGTYRDDLPEALTQIVARTLSKAPGERFQSADELGAALRALLPSSVVSPPPSATTATKTRSLAVLYLANLGSPEDEFLSYGITEDLIVDLSRVGSIRIPSMRKILKFKDSDLEPEELAAKLDVSLVLDGSIHRSGKRIRVSARLIEVATDRTRWADRWEEPEDRLPQIKKGLAEGISRALGLRSSQVESAQVGLPEAENPHAYENYLRGKYTFEHKKDAGDVDIALGLYRLALKEEPALLSARVGIAEIQLHQARLSEAHQELKKAVTEAETRGLMGDLAAGLRLMAAVHIQQSDWEQAWSIGSRALEIERTLANLSGEVESLGQLISILQPQGRFDEALGLFERVVEINRLLEDREKTAHALKNMGVAYARSGKYDRALELYREGLALARVQQDSSLEAAILSNIGNIHYFKGELRQSLDQYQAAMEINERLGHRSGAARQTQNVGLIHVLEGDYERGLECLSRAAAIFKELGDRSTYALTLANISQVHLMKGLAGDARSAAREALDTALAVNYPLAQVEAHHCLGSASAFEGKNEEARRHFERALEIAQEAGISRDFAQVHLALAGLHYYAGEPEHCRMHTDRAAAIATGIADRAAGLLSAAFGAALAAAESNPADAVARLRHLSREARTLSDTQLAVQVDTLLGYVLSQHGASASDRSEGLQVVQGALSLARERALAPAVLQLEGLIAELADRGG